MPSRASLRAPEVASANPEYRRRARHRFRRLSGGWRLASSGDWASGNPAFTIFRGSRSTPRPYAWARPLLSWHALVPFTFRIQVSHQTQEPSSEFLPAALGIQQGASRRSGSAAHRAPFVSALRTGPAPAVRRVTRTGYATMRAARRRGCTVVP